MQDDEDTELAVPLPVYSSDEDDEPTLAHQSSGDAGERMATLLSAIVHGNGVKYAPRVMDIAFWREFGAADDLHVEELAPTGVDGCYDAEASGLRSRLDRRGYMQVQQQVTSTEASICSRLDRCLRRLKESGFAPAFIYVFDETWHVIERHWRLLGAVLEPAGEPLAGAVLEPSFGAHVLSRPRTRPQDEACTEIQRHTAIGGAFSLPHRDHSTSDCFDERGAPTLLSLWVPLTPVATGGMPGLERKPFGRLNVLSSLHPRAARLRLPPALFARLIPELWGSRPATADNGCMFVVPKESDPLFLSCPCWGSNPSPIQDWQGTSRPSLASRLARLASLSPRSPCVFLASLLSLAGP